MSADWWADAVGRTVSLARTFEAADVAAYSRLTGDGPPPGEVPEPLLAGLFSTLLGVHLPGPGTNYLKQELWVRSAAHAGEELVAVVEVDRVVPDKRLVYLATTCRTTEGRVVLDGRALVLAGGLPVT